MSPPELANLLEYLNQTFETFSKVESRYFARLKELLVFHGIVSSTETVDRNSFTAVVKEFQGQKMNDPNPDGVPGENTLWALQKDWAGSRNLKLITSGIPNDAFQGAPLKFVLRSDIVPLYIKFYSTIHQQGGVITSAGSLRALNAEVSSGRSPTSMHYTGLALDLHTQSGMTGLLSSPYIIEKAGDRHWNVWNRVSPTIGVSRPVSEVIYHAGTKSTTITEKTIPVINFTRIAEEHGFQTVGCRSCFPQNYLCAEWWHFQCEEVLVPFISQFGAELLSVYSKEKLQTNEQIWGAKKKIFKKDWF